MEITYKEAVDNVRAYINNKDYEKDLSVKIEGDLHAPSALASVQMLDNMNDFAAKASFVHSMLLNDGLIVRHKDKVLVSVQVTEGMQLDDVEFFRLHPGVFQFVVEAVFGIFLKNSYPLSSESQKAD